MKTNGIFARLSLILFLIIFAGIVGQSAETPDWAVPYGKEFWTNTKSFDRQTPSEKIDANSSNLGVPAVSSSSLDLGKVIDRVSHAIETKEDGSYPTLRAKTYTAVFSPSGILFSPHQPGDGNNSSQPDSSVEARFQTRLVKIGNQDVYRSDGKTMEWRIQGNTAQALLNSQWGLIEHNEARETGIKMTWVLARRPEIAGSFVIEVEIGGLESVGQTSTGRHFGRSPENAQMRVSDVVVIDSLGYRWNVPIHMQSGRMSIEIPNDIMSQAVFPLAVDPTISPEFGMDQPVISPSSSYQTGPYLAWNGSIYLAVWTDQRNGNEDVFATRISSDGVVLDLNGIPISALSTREKDARVAWNGNYFLVVWADHRNGLEDIYCARVNSSGVLLDPNGIPVCTEAHEQGGPRVVGGTNQFLINWNDIRVGHHIYYSRITNDGVVLDPNGVELCSYSGQYDGGEMVWGSGYYFIVWVQDTLSGTTSNDIYGARIDSDGVVQDINGIPVCTYDYSQGPVSVSWDGTNYFAVWRDSRNISTTGISIYGARVNTDGVVLDSSGFPIIQSLDNQSGSRPIVNYTNNYFTVYWGDKRNGNLDIYGTRVNSSGIVLDATGIPIITSAIDKELISAVWNGSNSLIGWYDLRSGDKNAYAARISSTNTPLDFAGFLINTTVNNQSFPAVVLGDNQFFVVWQDDRNHNIDIYGTRVSCDGIILDTTGIPICVSSIEKHRPKVAWGNNQYCVVWEELVDLEVGDNNLLATRISPSGVVLDATKISVCNKPMSQSTPAISWNGNVFLVIWSDLYDVLNPGIYSIRGVRIGQNGNVLDSNEIIIADTSTKAVDPDVASDGNQFFVVWADNRNSYKDIYGARVNNAGIVLDTNGIAICTADYHQTDPKIAWNGSKYFVVCQDYRNSSDIYGNRIETTGTVLDGNGIRISPGYYASNPNIASDNYNFFVTWNDSFGTRVNSSGIILDGTGVLMCSGSKVDIVSSSSDKYYIVYGINYNSLGNASRIKSRLLDFNPPPTITVLSPNGGEEWLGNTIHDIVYSATGTISSVSMSYSINGGASWLPIAGPIPVSATSYSWAVPDITSVSCLVKIADASDGDLWDISNNTFIIQAQPTPTPTVTPTPTSTPTPTLTPTSTPVVTQTPSNAAWTLVSTTGPSKRYSHEMAFDHNLGKVVLFGGFDGENALNDTWTWNGSFWTKVSNGPLRLEHTMSYDESRKKIVLFGGSPDNATVINDTWEWDGIQWIQKAVTGPSPRYGSAMAYDSIRGKIVLFGGCANLTGTPTLNDTWEWDGTQWTQISSSGPSPRGGHTMVCDSHRGRIVLFGGNNNTVFLRDTWEWDGTIWTQVAATGPTARSSQSSSYDIGLDKVLIFGGIPTPGQRLCDTWVWDAFQWTQVATTGPQNRCAFAMAYDAARRKTILFGGSGLSYNKYNDTWMYGLPSSPAIEILSPNGAEVWQAGTTHNVVFSATGEIQSASIYFSTNMGSSWNFIAGPVSVSSGTNTYPWLIPSVNTTKCLIRVSGDKKGDVFDVSDNCLTINQLYSSLKLEPFNPFVFRNQNIELSVRISDITSLVGYRVALNLDPAKVSYVDGSATKVGTSTENGWGPIVVSNASPELALFTCASASGTIGNGSASLMKFQLHVNDALPDFTPITVTFNPLTSLNEDAIAYNAEIWNATVMGANHQPSFTSGGPVCVAEDCGPQTIAWATGISAGASYESWQSLFFTVEGYNPILFSATPSIDPSGILRFTPAPNANGITSATVYLHDTGGTENGGINVSTVHSLVISVTPVNDAPSFIHGATVTIVNMMPPMVHLFPSYATGITAGAPDEYGQLLNFLVSNNHPEKFSIQPMIFGSVGIQSSTMVIMPATNAHGVIQAQVCLYDNGGQEFGGVNHSATESFTIRLYKRFRWGDLNANDQAGSVDASLLLQYNAYLIDTFLGFPQSEYPEYYPPYYSVAFPQAADVNADGIAGTLDASLILQKYVFLIEYFPADVSQDQWGPDASIPPAKVSLRSIERRLTVSVEGQGSSWIVKFKLDNAQDLSGLRLALLYDPTQVSVDEKAAQWLVPSGMLVTNNLQEGRFIVAGALTVPLSEGPSELMSVKFDRIADSASSIVIRLDETTTQFNDGQIQLTPNSAMVFDLMNPTEIREWMIH